MTVLLPHSCLLQWIGFSKAPLSELFFRKGLLSGLFILLLMSVCHFHAGGICVWSTLILTSTHTKSNRAILWSPCFMVCASLSHQHGFASCLWAYVTEDLRQQSFLFSVSRPCLSFTLVPFIALVIQWLLFYSGLFCLYLTDRHAKQPQIAFTVCWLHQLEKCWRIKAYRAVLNRVKHTFLTSHLVWRK